MGTTMILSTESKYEGYTHEMFKFYQPKKKTEMLKLHSEAEQVEAFQLQSSYVLVTISMSVQ